MTDDESLCDLFRSLTGLPHETEWIEFKHNNSNPQDVGEYISALANSAALHRKDSAYLLWGVSNDPGHPIVGTAFRPRAERHKGQEIENWLATLLTPRVDFTIHEFECDGHAVVMFRVQPATSHPVAFHGTEYIRIGSYKKPLKEHVEKERALWALFSHVPFEKGVAVAGASGDEMLSLIDYPAFFQALRHPLPDNRNGIVDRLLQEKVVRRNGSRFDVTNLGGILFGRRLSAFDRLARKALRIIIYKGVGRLETVREQQGDRGYALGFKGAIGFINQQLPQNEQVGQALRREVRMYPEIAIRELVANALVHQDFDATGTGPMVEIFTDRMEITNPGTPLIDTLRFIDEPPQSRNEALTSFVRRLGICEERGSGIDKVVSSVEAFQLPAPDFTKTAAHTKATLFTYRKLGQMDRDDRIRACYQHSVLCLFSEHRMTNASLRQRFGIEDRNYPMASKIIREALDAKMIKPYDPANRSGKHISYVPFWFNPS